MLLVVLLIAVNGFFAGAEVALLSVRHSRLRQMAEEGQCRRAGGAQSALQSRAPALGDAGRRDAGQPGAGLGRRGHAVPHSGRLFHPVTTPLTAKFLHGASFAFRSWSSATSTWCWAKWCRRTWPSPKPTAWRRWWLRRCWCSTALMLAFVVVIERSAGRHHARAQAEGRRHGNGHSAEELKLIVSSSRGLGYLPEAQEDMIHRVLDLGAMSRCARSWCRATTSSPFRWTPRSTRCCETMIEKRHSRLPVYEGAPEKIVGILHYKDLLPVWEERRRAIARAGPAAPFTSPGSPPAPGGSGDQAALADAG
jgi:putative hemolysin